MRAQIEASGVRAAAIADGLHRPPSRNFIVGAIIDALLSMLADFERDGFSDSARLGRALDALRDSARRRC